MIQLQKSEFRTAGASSAINTTVNDDTKGVASIPGWNFLLSPEVQLANGGIKNIVTPSDFTTPSNPSQVLVQSTAPDGNAMLEFPASDPINRHLINARVNKKEWTAFFVCYLPAGNGPDEVFCQNSVSDPDLALRFGFNTTGILRIWKGSGSFRLSYGTGAADFYDRTVYCMATFSTTDGLRIFVNGELKASLANYDPLTIDLIQLFAPDTSQNVGGFNGFMGHVGLLDIGLADLVNSEYKTVLDNWIMSKYGISV